MNLKFYLAVILAIQLVIAQKVPSNYEVATWSGFRSAAITYTFDDGCSNQLAIAVPAFDRYNFKLTLFTVTSLMPNITDLQHAFTEGHEIASHTITHSDLSGMGLAKQITELKGSKDALEQKIPGLKCLTIAYPYCSRGVDSATSMYYVAARGCQGVIEPSTPGSFMNIRSIICGELGSVKTVNDFKTNFQNAASSNGWCVFLIHGIDNDGGYSPLPSDTLKSSLQYLNDNKQTFWVTTFLNAVLYIKERNSLNIIEKAKNDTAITLQIIDTLADSIYNVPITVRTPLLQNWSNAIVTQKGVNVPTSIIKNQNTTYVTFDITPDQGDVKIIKSSDPTSIQSNVTKVISRNDKIHIALTRNHLVLSTPANSNTKSSITIYNLKGAIYWSGKMSAGYANVFLPKALDAGIYTIIINSNKNSWSKKIMVN